MNQVALKQRRLIEEEELYIVNCNCMSSRPRKDSQMALKQSY